MDRPGNHAWCSWWIAGHQPADTDATTVRDRSGYHGLLAENGQKAANKQQDEKQHGIRGAVNRQLPTGVTAMTQL